MIALSLLSFLLGWLTSLYLAQALGAEGFDDYAVAVAALAVMSTAAEAGTGKFGLREWPALRARGDWAGARAFPRFATLLVLTLSLLLAALAASSEGLEDHVFADYALGPGALFLPAIALAGLWTELGTAMGAPLAAAFVVRVLIPGLGLALVVFGQHVFSTFDASRAVELHGASWVVGALCLAFLLRARRPAELREVVSTPALGLWVRGSLGYLAVALTATLLAKVGLLALEYADIAEEEVAVMAVAFETGGFVYVLSKSTDKLFVPQISAELSRGELGEVRRLLRRRDRLIGGASLLFLASMIVFGRPLLGLFGPTFVHGYFALVVVTAASVALTLASLSGWVLSMTRSVYTPMLWQGLTVFLIAIATVIAAPRWGLDGALAAYALPMGALAMVSRWAAAHDLRGRALARAA